MKKKILIIVTVVILFLVLAVFTAYQQFQTAIKQPLNIPEMGLIYSLKPGTSIRALSQDLEKKGIIKKSRTLEWLARREKKATKIRAGEYKLEPGLTPESLLDLFVEGKIVQYKFSIVEGTRYADALKSLLAIKEIEHSVTPETFVSDFKAWTGEDHPEGWLFPDTYYFTRDDDDKTLLLRAYQNMKTELEKAWEKRQSDLPLKTPYEALILASIVEKETAVAKERPLIAGVFINRLRKGMKLQTDPTVIYGMGDQYKGNIRKKDLKKDTPYNTYTRTGLPPTPIALVGKEALEAVVNPASTEALFFVAKGGGEHHFSKTYKEHRKAVIRYQLNGNAKRYKGDE